MRAAALFGLLVALVATYEASGDDVVGDITIPGIKALVDGKPPAATDPPAGAPDDSPSADPTTPDDPQKPETTKPGKRPGDAKQPPATYVPLNPRGVYVHVEGEAHPGAAAAVPWRYHPDLVKQGRDPQDLVQAEEARLAAVGPEHMQWEQRMQSPLVRIETRHATIQAQLTPAVAMQCGQALEALAGHLQLLTRSVMLTPTRPNDCVLVICADSPQYKQLLTKLKADGTVNISDLNLAMQTSGITGDVISIADAHNGASVPPHHMALSQFAAMSMRRATGGRAPMWLVTGFSYYSEWAVTHKNLVHSIRYQLNDIKIDGSWNKAVIDHAQRGELRPLTDLFTVDLANYNPGDHLAVFSFTSFLIQTDPARFLKFIEAIGGGADTEAALQTAYESDVARLQKLWGAWALRQQ
jgi:hypothetical protein